MTIPPSSTKNQSGERDPEMHQTRKGKQWYFGAKAHIGVDSKETVVHSVCTSAASVADVHLLPDLLHGEVRKVWGDGAYQGQREVICQAAPQAQDMTSRRTKYKNDVDEEAKRKNTTKARVRAKVEHPFRILKRIFGFTKVRYRDREKPPMVVRGLRAGEPLPTPETAGPAGGVVCPGPGTGVRGQEIRPSYTIVITIFRTKQRETRPARRIVAAFWGLCRGSFRGRFSNFSVVPRPTGSN
jgi:hypothetical protein